MKNSKTVIFLLCLAALISCGEDRTKEFFEQTKETQWIYTTMKKCYMWKDQIKPQERSKFFVPASNFFSSLLYKDDKASFFTDSVYKGDYGMSFTLMRAPVGDNPSQVYALVLFVEPESPAGKAGVRRGTWISAINGKKLSTSSTPQLTSGDEIELATEYIEYDDLEDKRIWMQGDTITVGPSAPYNLSDIYVDTVHTVRDRNVGYILCNGFDSDDFADRINKIAGKFVARDVTDIVIDLRYNTGGSIANASCLASMLVPSERFGTPFCILSKGDNEVDTVYNYVQPQYTFHDKNIHFITGAETKGAAELLVSSVNIARGAYEVMTFGKSSVGSSMMVEKIDSPYGFSINPAVAYAFLPDGSILPEAGVTPDYVLDELAQKEQAIYLLGSTQEYLLYNVIYKITNGTLPEEHHAVQESVTVYTPQRRGYLR